MANESFLQLPLAADEATTRRALSRIIEEVDVLIGNRLVPGRQSINNLSELLIALRSRIATLSNDTRKELKVLEQRIVSLQQFINNNAILRSVALTITATNPTTITFGVRYNVATAARVGVGLWRFTVEQSSILGNPILGNSTGALAWVIAPTALNFVSVELTNLTTTTFDLQVRQSTVATDLAAGDQISCTLLFTPPTAGLPPA